jgi:drug/metabolite transporter (DMT)-like permease
MNRQNAWLRLMLIAFVTNGLGPFGLKMLAERGLAENYHFHYLLWWYAGGLLLALTAFALTRSRPYQREVLIAAVMGLGSFGGQLFSSLALEAKVPGHIVFPATTGGNLFLVAAAGILLFREKVGPYGIAGILTGIVSLVLLSLG